MKLKILVALLAAALVVGGGAVALTRFLAPADDEAIALAPADSFFYANLFIRPSNDQKMALDDLLKKFPGVESADDVIQKIVDALDEGLAAEGLDYEEDIEPWLGDQLAIFVAPGATPDEPKVAALIESKDDGAAADFIEKTAAADDVELEDRSYEGVEYRADPEDEESAGAAVIDGFLVFGTEDGIKAAIDSSLSEETLETDEDFVAATDPLRDDWIGLFYANTPALFEELAAAGEATTEDLAALDALGFEDQDPAAGVLYVTSDSIAFEGSSGVGPLGGGAATGGIVPELPGEAWIAFGISQLGDKFGTLIDTLGAAVPGFDRDEFDGVFFGQTGLDLERDVLSWMEDLGIFVQGTSIQDIGGGIVIESSDSHKTGNFLEGVRSLIVLQGVRPRVESRGSLEGFSVQIPGVPAPFYALGGDRLVLAYGDDATDAAAGDGPVLAESDAFRAAQDHVGEDFDVSFFLDVDAAQRFGETVAGFAGAPMDTYEQEVKPYIDPATHVVTASKREGDRVVLKFVIGFE